MKNFKLLCLLLIICCSVQSYGQQKDIGVRVSTNLNNIGFIYKKSLKKENRYLRLSGANFSFVLGESFQNAASIDIGWENRKFYNDKFALIHGWKTGVQWNISINNFNSAIAAIPNVGYILGLHYQINKHLYLNVEAQPSLFAQYNSQSNNLNLTFNGNTASGAQIWLVYNFKKE